MDYIILLIVLFIGGTVILSAAWIPFSSERGSGWRRWVTAAASCFLVVGAAGFFGSALSAAGGLNWLPSSFEWPVGYSSGVVSTAEGWHVVPHSPSGRIQLYDADWKFVRGWHVDGSGGSFKLLVPRDNHIEVITARRRRHYVFNLEGQLIAKTTYEPKTYDAFPTAGESFFVPTAPWLWTFSHPGYSWAVAVLGMVILGTLQRHRSGRTKLRNAAR